MEKLYTPERRKIRDKFYKSYRWLVIRKNQFRKRGKLCERCLSKGKLTLGNTVNHTNPDWEDWESFKRGPFEIMCYICHKRQTQLDLQKLRKAEKTKQEVLDV